MLKSVVSLYIHSCHLWFAGSLPTRKWAGTVSPVLGTKCTINIWMDREMEGSEKEKNELRISCIDTSVILEFIHSQQVAGLSFQSSLLKDIK